MISITIAREFIFARNGFSRVGLVVLLMLAPSGSARAADDYEGDGPGECTDKADNDRDGKFDCDDEGCANGPDCKLAEGDVAGQCTDRADNDRDGKFDCDDPDCASSAICRTKRPERQLETRSAGPVDRPTAEDLAELQGLLRQTHLGRNSTVVEYGYKHPRAQITTAAWCDGKSTGGDARTSDYTGLGFRTTQRGTVSCDGKWWRQWTGTIHWSEMDYCRPVLLPGIGLYAVAVKDRITFDGDGGSLVMTETEALAEDICSVLHRIGVGR